MGQAFVLKYKEIISSIGHFIKDITPFMKAFESYEPQESVPMMTFPLVEDIGHFRRTVGV